MVDVYDMLRFECHAKFQINWESSAHRDQQETSLRYVALLNNYLPLDYEGDRRQVGVYEPISL